MQAAEIADLEARIERAADALQGIAPALLTPVTFTPQPASLPPRLLEGVRIAMARDAAFAFLYRANLDLLQAMGAALHFFSPLSDAALPDVDALYLPGGYPELHLATLGANTAMKAAIHAHHAADKPLVAECGGLLYLLESLTDAQGQSASMVGLLEGNAMMQTKLANLGLHSVSLPQGEIRGHTFHYSRLETALPTTATSVSKRAGGRGEAVYQIGRLHASYLHLYFPSNPVAVAALFGNA